MSDYRQQEYEYLRNKINSSRDPNDYYHLKMAMENFHRNGQARHSYPYGQGDISSPTYQNSMMINQVEWGRGNKPAENNLLLLVEV